MRKIKKDFNNPPKELTDCASKNEIALLETKKTKSNCYKKSKEELEIQFHNKCAYCETVIKKSNTYTTIDHYRPKSTYYWLVSEWSNLLLSCQICNTTKSSKFPLIADNKKNKFPPLLNGNLNVKKCKADNSVLIDERPYILHPKIDEPKKYFDFKIDKNYAGIEIIGTDSEGSKDLKQKYIGKGQATIEICDLNRPELKTDRYKKVIREIVKSFEKILKFLIVTEAPANKYYNAFKLDFKNITEQANNDILEHTLLRQAILDTQKFDSIICSSIENNENLKTYISTAYEKYQREN